MISTMLGSLLARRERLAPFEVLAIAADVCAGLAAAHAADVLHRDLKPENVIVAKDGRAVITDFGIARAIAKSELARTHGGMAGTPAYMSPEQVEGASDLDARTDLYALGTMMYERTFETFIGVGKNNPTLLFDVPPPDPM